MNHQRPPDLRRLLRLDLDFYTEKRQDLVAMRTFLLKVAESRLAAAKANATDITGITLDDMDWGAQVEHLNIHNWLPDNWLTLYAPLAGKAFPAFTARLLELAQGIDPSADFCALSFLELALWLSRQPGFHFPYEVGGAAQMRPLNMFFTRPVWLNSFEMPSIRFFGPSKPATLSV